MLHGFIKLEKILGRSIATCIFTMVNGMLLFFTTTPIAIAASVAQLLGFVLMRITTGSLVDYDAYESPTKSSDRACDPLFGMVGGFGAGCQIKTNCWWLHSYWFLAVGLLLQLL